jgi:hypothetical protein
MHVIDCYDIQNKLFANKAAAYKELIKQYSNKILKDVSDDIDITKLEK